MQSERTAVHVQPRKGSGAEMPGNIQEPSLSRWSWGSCNKQDACFLKLKLYPLGKWNKTCFLQESLIHSCALSASPKISSKEAMVTSNNLFPTVLFINWVFKIPKDYSISNKKTGTWDPEWPAMWPRTKHLTSLNLSSSAMKWTRWGMSYATMFSEAQVWLWKL